MKLGNEHHLFGSEFGATILREKRAGDLAEGSFVTDQEAATERAILRV
jgi:hypothetical protein